LTFNAKITVNRDAVDKLFVDVFVQSYDKAPQSIVIDLDATSAPEKSITAKPGLTFFIAIYIIIPLSPT